MGRRFHDYLLDSVRPSPKVDKTRCSAHICTIVKGNRILSTAVNQSGTRSSGCGFSRYTIHAEMNALKHLGDIDRLRGATMYVWRFNARGQPTNSKPCSQCQRVLDKCMREYGLKQVFYTPESS
jgi:deoxycytidylate deaminase